MQAAYPPPVDQLLSLGYPDPEHAGNLPAGKYAALGLTRADRESLLRMSCDGTLYDSSEEDSRCWAPIHAWRALCEFRDIEAVPTLLQLWDDEDNEWAREDMITMFPDFGPPMIAHMLPVADNPKRNLTARLSAVEVIQKIAQGNPEVRVECVAHLAERLDRYMFLPRELNAFLIGGLTVLRAVECAPLIERAFAADAVDLSVHGDWIDVQYELGLTTTRPEGRGQRMLDAFALSYDGGPADGMSADERTALRKQRAKAEKKAKQKRQQAKLNRKRNR